jgi:PleD family two-component response regulator
MTNRNASDIRERYNVTVDSGRLESKNVEASTSSSGKQSIKRILVVDDNSDIALTLRLGLEDNDSTMQVNCYDNPINALSDFKPNFYDLLLIDINMPMMDARNYCRKISMSEYVL